MPVGTVSRPWRRYLRLRVRGLIVLVLVIGAGMGWIVRIARNQRAAVAAIKSAGGSVSYIPEWTATDDVGIHRGEDPAQRWLADLIGVDYFGHVTCVDMPSTSTDTTIAPVGRLTQLEDLDLWGASVSDAGLVHLEGLTNLTVLNLTGTQVTDAGLAHLKGLTNLTWLFLKDTQVNGAGLAHLKALTNLTNLCLSNTQVTDAGLVNLKGLTNLSLLDLDGTKVTDAGLAHLKGLTRLSRLDLRGTQVTDAGAYDMHIGRLRAGVKQDLPDLTINR